MTWYLEQQVSFRFFNRFILIIFLDLKHFEFLDLRKELYKWTDNLYFSLYFFDLKLISMNKFLFLNSLFFKNALFKL